MEFEQYHWVSKKSDQIRPRTIISKAKKFKDKQKIVKNGNYMKDTGTYIYGKNYRIKYWNIVGKTNLHT